jgi:hypothetical protein
MDTWAWMHERMEKWIHVEMDTGRRGNGDLKYWGMLTFYKKIKLKPR